MEISRLHRTVTIVARGRITADEARGLAQQLADAHVRPFAKVVDVATAIDAGDITPEQVGRMAALLRGDGSEKRGPVAFIVDAARGAFARTFASQTGEEGPISVFTSLREARAWLERVQYGPPADDPKASPWTDPHRRGVMLRGRRHRPVAARGLLVGA